MERWIGAVVFGRWVGVAAAASVSLSRGRGTSKGCSSTRPFVMLSSWKALSSVPGSGRGSDVHLVRGGGRVALRRVIICTRPDGPFCAD